VSTLTIYHYLKVNEQLITGGQPTEEQLRSAADEEFEIVINLGTINPRYSLPDEAGLVRSLGMAYHNIPVDWNAPQRSDFEAFERLMQTLPAAKTLLHCAANFRVTAFYSLYALKHLGWTEDQAAEFRASVWQVSDYPVWEKFVSNLTSQITGGAQ
jgi:protein tyrosine phosphatase (PTP) superfamily phosphohydrolase (DUF442 family)